MWWKNYLQKIIRQVYAYYAGKRRTEYTGPSRYFGKLRLIKFMNRPVIIGNSLKIKSHLPNLGFRWDGNLTIDGTPFGDAPNNIINGAWIRSKELTESELNELVELGVDVSMKDENFDLSKSSAPSSEVNVNKTKQEQLQSDVDTSPQQQGAQSDKANIEMILKLQEASNYKETVEVITEQLEKLKKMLTNPDISLKQRELKEKFLKFMSRSYNYSLFNTFLIFLQNTNAQLVGGEKNFWNANGRRLKPGQKEKPIQILAPIFTVPFLSKEEYRNLVKQLNEQGITDKNEIKKQIEDIRQKRRFVSDFKNVPVYDISQTEPIPDWKHPVTGEPPIEYEDFYESYKNKMNTPSEYADSLFYAAKRAAESKGIKVVVQNTGKADGFSSGGTIVINQNSFGERKVSTLFHEFAHEILHTNKKAREERKKEKIPLKILESEAESVAFLLCQAFGIVGDEEWAARYLSTWNVTPEEIIERQNRIHQAYKEILNLTREQMDKIVSNH